MNYITKHFHHLIAIAIFLILTCIYFAPSIFDNKVIQQGDMEKGTGMAKELKDYYEKEDGKSAWTGSMFSGMPAYHIYVYGNPLNYLGYIEEPFKSLDYLGGSMILTALICFYILMCVVGVKRWLAIAGAIAFALASYNLIIIMAGHITKMYVIAYMPLTIAGMIVLFRKKWLWGMILLTLGVGFSVANSHLQITYYLALFSLLFFIGLSVNKLWEKEYLVLAKIIGLSILSVVIAILPVLGSLYSNYEVGQESLRGASELTSTATGEEKGKISSGLDIDYAFRWSYGQGELLTLLIPNAYGGASGETLDDQSEFYKTYQSLGGNVGRTVQAPTYWGTQPFTSGPVYYGAIVCFLFVLGMFVIKNPIKWWIAGASLLFILMSLGRNFNLLNEFLFYHLPMYNKFRVPSMALVIPGLTFPFIGIWGLKCIIEEKLNAQYLKKSLIYSFSIVGGICLLIWIMPSMFLDFSVLPANTEVTAKTLTPALAEAYPDLRYKVEWPAQLFDALLASRKSLASSDAFRSFLLIGLSAALIFFFLRTKNKKTGAIVLSVGMLALITIDLWAIDKRYLNDNSFSDKKFEDSYQKTAADEYILQDTSQSYRVL
ncbi:MAG: hypothetical protein LBQ64_03410, partial [Bacteroidales bacterium]|nr:hypothetical protein [Bacteroidales bacterium]